MMRDRLRIISELLAPDGSVWVHLDDTEIGYCRVMMDEIFGRDHFIATVIWEKSDSPRMDAKNFSGRHDYILVYGKSEAFQVNRLTEGEPAAHYRKTDEKGRPYYLKPLRAMGGQGSTREARPNLYFALEAPDGTEVWPKLADGGDGAWRWSKKKIGEEPERIEWVQGDKGWAPYFRIYDKGAGRPPETIWPHTEVGSNRTSKREIKDLFPRKTPFDTPKPERLMARILQVASSPGDLVLDCFAGSGTTAAVAHKMGRRWITSEWSASTVEAFALPRLKKVVEGADRGGVTDDADWSGGGGFRVLDVAPSMFEDDEGIVVLADWATQNALSEATAAQLKFAYEDDPPFAGRKGKMRLAVIDGLVSEAVLELLLSALPEDERLTICGTTIDDLAAESLRKRRPGSRMRKIPASILAEYQQVRRWKPALAAEDAEPTVEQEAAAANGKPRTPSRERASAPKKSASSSDGTAAKSRAAQPTSAKKVTTRKTKGS
jgi:adenine-specific DNA-methyltransferase